MTKVLLPTRRKKVSRDNNFVTAMKELCTRDHPGDVKIRGL